MALPVIGTATMEKIVKMQLKEKNTRPLLFLGKGGIGKSKIIETVAKEMGIGYIDIRLLLYTETDIKGIPYPDADRVYTVWLQNDILPRVDKHGETGILVLDEITSAPRSVRTAVYQLLNERKLGSYELPENWYIVCLGNGEEDGGDFNGLEGNFANRCSIFRVESTVDDFRKYAIKSGMHPYVIAYTSWMTKHLHTYNEDNTMEDGLLFASPRSWEAVSDIIKNREKDEWYDGTLSELDLIRINGNIGTEVGQCFGQFIKYSDKVVMVDKILDGRAVTEYPKDVEALILTTNMLVQSMCKEANMDDIDFDIKLNRIANGTKWLLGMERMELVTMGLKDFIDVGGTEVMDILMSEEFDDDCPELAEFAEEHKEVFR